MAQHFLLLLTLQYNIIHVWKICGLEHVLYILRPSSELLRAAVAHSTFSSSYRLNYLR